MLWLTLLLAPLLTLAALYAAAHHSRGMTPAYGLVDGRLRPCPPTPNCVGSEPGPSRLDKQVAPLRPGAHATEQAWPALQRAITAQGGVLVLVTSDYLTATFKTPLLGFVDDFEARFDKVAGVIHLRSASRVGRSDLGANRARLERLTAAYTAELERPETRT